MTSAISKKPLQKLSAPSGVYLHSGQKSGRKYTGGLPTARNYQPLFHWVWNPKADDLKGFDISLTEKDVLKIYNCAKGRFQHPSARGIDFAPIRIAHQRRLFQACSESSVTEIFPHLSTEAAGRILSSPNQFIAARKYQDFVLKNACGSHDRFQTDEDRSLLRSLFFASAGDHRYVTVDNYDEDGIPYVEFADKEEDLDAVISGDEMREEEMREEDHFEDDIDYGDPEDDEIGNEEYGLSVILWREDRAQERKAAYQLRSNDPVPFNIQDLVAGALLHPAVAELKRQSISPEYLLIAAVMHFYRGSSDVKEVLAQVIQICRGKMDTNALRLFQTTLRKFEFGSDTIAKTDKNQQVLAYTQAMRDEILPELSK